MMLHRRKQQVPACRQASLVGQKAASVGMTASKTKIGCGLFQARNLLEADLDLAANHKF